MCGYRFAGLAFVAGFVVLGDGCGTSHDQPASDAAPAVATNPSVPKSNRAPSAAASTTSAPAEKSETDAAAATPVDAIARWLAAAKSGDIRRVAAALAPPMDSLILEQDQVRTDVLVAHEKLNRELDAAFGPRTDQSQRPFGSALAEEILADLSRNPLKHASAAERAALEMKVVEQREEPGRVLLTVEVTELRKKQPISTKWAAIKAGQGWKVVPAHWKADELRAEIERSRTLLESYRTSAREVREGQYKSRQQVDSVLDWALAVSRPSLFMANPPHELMEILPQPSDSKRMTESMRIGIHVDASAPNQTARVTLRSLTGAPLQWDRPLDGLLPKLTELHKSLGGQLQPSWILTLDPHPSQATLEVLKALLDAGFDYRRVLFDGREPQIRELERQLSGRLRLFAIRIPGAGTGGSMQDVEGSRIRDEGKGTDDKLTQDPPTQMDLNVSPDRPGDERRARVVEEAVSPTLEPGTIKAPQLDLGTGRGLLPSPDGGSGTGGSSLPSIKGTTFGRNLGPAHVTRLREAKSFDAGVSPVAWLSFSPDGKWIAAAALSERVNFWDSSTTRLVRSLVVPLSPVACQFCPTDQNCFACSLRQVGKVQLWRVSESKVVREFKVADPTAIAFRPDGKRLACASSDGTVQTWDTQSGQLLSTVRPLGGRAIDGLAYRPDGLRIATYGSVDKIIGIWDPESPGRVETFASKLPFIGKITFSPDGRSVAAVGAATIRVWHLGSGKPPAFADCNFATPAGTRGTFSHASCAFSPNGEWLAGGTEHEIAIWKTARTKPVVSLADPHSQARGPIAWSPDGKQLVSAGPGPTVKVWHVD